MKQTDFDQLEAYFDGQLSQEQQKELEARRLQDPELADLWEKYEGAQKLLELGMDPTMLKLESQAARTITFRRLWPLMAVAAAIILLFLTIPFGTDSASLSPDELFAANFEAYAAPAVRQEDSLTAQSPFGLAMQAYQQNKWQEAHAHFSQISDSSSKYQEAIFFQGNVYLIQDLPENAIPLFEAILQKGDVRFKTAAEWYLSLAYLKSGQTPAAKRLLEQIVAQENAYQDRAQEILEALE